MTITNPALNFNFAAAEGARLAFEQRGSEEVVAAQLRQAATENNAFKVGATVTARYQYKVAADGSFIPVQTQITTDAPDADKQGLANGRRNARRPLREDGTDRPPSFADFTPPKPHLSPADEISVFATLAQSISSAFTQATPRAGSTTAPGIRAAEVVDEDGQFVQAEIFFGPTIGDITREASSTALNSRAQFSVATLYARNHNAQYQVEPVVQFAA